jgi:hypothetical protein
MAAADKDTSAAPAPTAAPATSPVAAPAPSAPPVVVAAPAPAIVPPPVVAAVAAVPPQTAPIVSLDEFMQHHSLSEKRVELLNAFAVMHARAGKTQDTHAGFARAFQAFANAVPA